ARYRRIYAFRADRAGEAAARALDGGCCTGHKRRGAMRSPRQHLKTALALVALVAACRNQDKQTTKESSAETVPTKTTPAARTIFADERGRYDLIDNLSRCRVEHRGLLLDLGASGTRALRGFSVSASDTEPVDREGATFERIFSRELR